MALVHFLSFILSGLLSWSFLWILIPILRCRLLDQPNARSSHSHPTPRGGGISFVLVSAVASVLAWLLSGTSFSDLSPLLFAPLLAFPLALVGFLDDRYNLPASWRYGAQLATAIVLIMISPLVISSIEFLPYLVLFVIAVTAVINFTNFMDGIDGLLAGCMFVAIAASAVHFGAPWPILALLGALLGFLFWNWSPAKVFMGDVGSTFLGAVFSVLVLQTSTWSEAVSLLLMVTPLLADASICVLRRLLAGQRVFQAHRMHLFQRLHQAGWSHARVSILYVVATSVLACAVLLGDLTTLITLTVCELLLGVWLDQKVAIPFNNSSYP